MTFVSEYFTSTFMKSAEMGSHAEETWRNDLDGFFLVMRNYHVPFCRVVWLQEDTSGKEASSR